MLTTTESVPFVDTLPVTEYVRRRLDQYATDVLKRPLQLQDVTTAPAFPLIDVHGVVGWTLEEISDAVQAQYGCELHPGHWEAT